MHMASGMGAPRDASGQRPVHRCARRLHVELVGRGRRTAPPTWATASAGPARYRRQLGARERNCAHHLGRRDPAVVVLLERDVRLVGQLEADGVAAGDARPGDVHEARPLAEASAVQLEPALERVELARPRRSGGAVAANTISWRLSPFRRRGA